jgi:antitoxin component of RelBE/YafQ-DinJ toxin-antitoxin module
MSTRISAHISEGTKAQVEAFVKRYGITKARLIEEALQHHMQALREIPSDLVVPSRLVVTEDSIKRVAARLASNEPPTPALRELLLEGAASAPVAAADSTYFEALRDRVRRRAGGL